MKGGRGGGDEVNGGVEIEGIFECPSVRGTYQVKRLKVWGTDGCRDTVEGSEVFGLKTEGMEVG